MVPILIVAIVVWGLLTLYFAIRSREFRKFLAGAFFVSAGIQLYLYLVNVSVPLIGTSIVLTPEISGVRSILHFIFFLVTFYFGFIRKPKDSSR
jgi:disulfide bond formation protein DsbB